MTKCFVRQTFIVRVETKTHGAFIDQFIATRIDGDVSAAVEFVRELNKRWKDTKIGVWETAYQREEGAKINMSKSVLQDWVMGLTFMQQTVLLTAVRGPDSIPKYHPTKFMLRWYRRCILLSSLDNGTVLNNPYDHRGGSFMGPSFNYEPENNKWQTGLETIVSEYLRSLDELPHHFQMHFMHAAEIVGYKHPDDTIKAWWNKTYLRLVHDMHVWPETEEQLDSRLGDNREQWLARNDEATVT